MEQQPTMGELPMQVQKQYLFYISNVAIIIIASF